MERIETNSQFAQIISPSEMIAIVTISIKLGDTEGLMNVCLPYSVLEPVMDKLNTKYWFSTMQHRDVKTYEDAISSLISKAQIPIKAVLGNSTISVNDFLNLRSPASGLFSGGSLYYGDVAVFPPIEPIKTASEAFAVAIASSVKGTPCTSIEAPPIKMCS